MQIRDSQLNCWQLQRQIEGGKREEEAEGVDYSPTNGADATLDAVVGPQEQRSA